MEFYPARKDPKNDFSIRRWNKVKGGGEKYTMQLYFGTQNGYI